MERQEELQDIIDRHLLGRSNAADEAKLAAEMAANPGLAGELELESEAVAAIDALGDQQMKARLQAIEQRMQSTPLQVETQGKGAKVVPFYRRKIFAIAASFLLLLVAGWFIMSQNSGLSGPETFAASFEPYRNIAVPLTRSAENPTAEELAYTAYENGDWKAAKKAIAALPDSEINRFYLAQVALAEGDFKVAKSILQQQADNKAFPLQTTAEWYLALTLLSNEEEAEAQTILDHISAQNDHPFQRQASDLLK